MPTQEAIVNTIIPREVEKPIPVRTVSTILRKANQDQANINRTDSTPAVSGIPEESLKLSGPAIALARKEQAHRQRELALKERERQVEARLADAEKFEKLRAKIGEKDFSEAEALGLNYEDYVEYKLKSTGEVDPRDQKFQEIQDEVKNLKKQQEESIQRQYEETVSEYRSEIKKLVAEKPEFSKIKKMNAEEHVLQLIIDTFEEDGTQLTVDKAAKDVEMFLTEEKKKWDALSDEGVEAEMQRPTLPRPTRTLTNEMTAGAQTARPQKSLQHMSDEERYAEARRRVLERRQQQGR